MKPKRPELKRGAYISVSRGVGSRNETWIEYGIVLNDTPAGSDPEYLVLGTNQRGIVSCIGSRSLPQNDQAVELVASPQEIASAIKRLCEKLGPLMGRVFPELWGEWEEL